jgi:hypothetical protein
MDVSTPPSLDLACPQEKTKLGKHDHRFMDWSVDNQNTDKKHHIHQGTNYNRQQLLFICYGLLISKRESQIKMHKVNYNWWWQTLVLGHRTMNKLYLLLNGAFLKQS